MYESEQLEIWNLTPHVKTMVGAQPIFNVVGRLKLPQSVSSFSYRLNDGPERQIVFNKTSQRMGRLQRQGDFNIDTIQTTDLRVKNRLVFRIVHFGSCDFEETIDFPTTADQYDNHQPRFCLDLNQVQYPQQVGEIVDGRWLVAGPEDGPACLEVTKTEAGYDRIVLFGRHTWTTAYEINARLMVTRWTAANHNVGLLFKWNPHLQGDGSQLPTKWSTGLAYYVSDYGLQIRYGVNVHRNEKGEKIGSYVLAEKPLARWRHQAWKLHRRLLTSTRKPARLLSRRPIAQVEAGIPYRFRAVIHPRLHTLTVWKEQDSEPSPQLVVEQPTEWLPQGAVGFIAHKCAARLYEYEVAPV
jgi:hypothetical protein